MALVINSNIQSLNAQRNLTLSQGDQNTAMERLTSGKRINSAADDAAGLAISTRMSSQIRGLDQAVRNANDGISLIQTAEGALAESSNILQRMRELAIQSANGIYSDGDRSTLNAEMGQLVSELDRISQTTSFNSQNILDGSLQDVKLQVGAEANQTISFSISATDTSSLGLGATSSDLSGGRLGDLSDLQLTDSTAGAVGFSDGDVLINGTSIGSFDGSSDSLDDLMASINDSGAGVTASAVNVIEADGTGTGVLGSDTLTIRVYGNDSVAADTDGTSYTDYSITGTTDLDDLVETINTKTGGRVEASLNDSGNLVLSNAEGESIALGIDANKDLATVLGLSATAESNQGGFDASDDAGAFGVSGGVGAFDSAVFTGSLVLESDDNSAIAITTGANGVAADLTNLGFVEVTAGTVQGGALDSTAQGTALAAGDLAINGVSIAATDASEGLQGKVDNINDVSADTGVVASAKAEQSYGYDASITAVEVTGNAAFSDPTDGAATQLYVDGAAAPTVGALAVDRQVNTISFNVNDGSGADTVLLDAANYADADALIADINGQLAAATSTVTAFNDGGKISFQNTAAAAITVDGYVAGGTEAVGSANALLGFDIEDLAGSGGSFTSSTGSAFNVNGTEIDLTSYQADGTLSATEVATAVNTATATTGVTAYVDDSDILHFSSTSAFTLSDDAQGSGFVESLDGGTNLGAGNKTTEPTSGSLVINGFEVTGISLTDIDSAVTTINGDQSNTGVVAKVDDNGQLQLSANQSITLQVGDTAGLAVGNTFGINFADESGSEDGIIDTQTVNAGIQLRSVNEGTISIDVTANGTTATGLQNMNTDLSALVSGSAISSISIATAEQAQGAIESIDNALDTVNDIRSGLGAVSNRLDFTINNLSSISENTSAAKSRIVDADYAAESAALSRSQVLQQAGTAMLAQANAQPQQVLSLLQ